MEGQNKATCNICKIVRSIPTGTTTTLQNHLKKHVTAYNKFLRLKQLKESTAITKNKLKEKSNKQMSLKKSLGRTMAYDSSSKRAQEITRAIAIFICKGLHAYCRGTSFQGFNISPRAKICCPLPYNIFEVSDTKNM